MGSPERELCPPPSEEDELTLPRASINKMIKELVPSVRVAFESRELILNCCTEFIHLISSEANEVCNQSNKKTINAEHVLMALDRLGFSDYTVEAEAVLKDCKAVAAKRRRQSTRLENLGIPEEELFRQQQELFAKAREEQAKQEQQQWLLLQQQGLAGADGMPQSYIPPPSGLKQESQEDDDDDYS
ncbi:protein Dr1 [Danaus plexippus]|uniref:Protein Dr1 n=1 Tax=Danaus plexippus plexippus TaxID=278856 RepID=A0A212F0S4_DANPL|nr:protein Dr1 [Danaus plexippus]OWR47330.1 tata-binding protein-associated phosphoprotein [Danaus plexippus plexippus]